MTAVTVRAALEKALKAVTPSIKSVFENEPYTAVKDTPYQQVHILFAEPDNAENTAAYTERGFMQVMLLYPANAGAGDAQAQAQVIRSAFPRGRSIQGDGVVVLIVRTAEIAPGQPDADRYAVPVRVRFEAQVEG